MTEWLRFMHRTGDLELIQLNHFDVESVHRTPAVQW